MAPALADRRMTLVDGSHPDGHDEAGAGAMNRQQRREFFERLCALRDAYALRGPDDTTSAISIEAMIARASRRLDRPRAPLVVVADDSASA
jgi:hypothetical protein